jgi:hypothetical protein
VVPEHGMEAGVPRRPRSVPDVWGSARHPLCQAPGAGPDGPLALEDRPHLEVSPERPARPQPPGRAIGSRRAFQPDEPSALGGYHDAGSGAASAPIQHSKILLAVTNRDNQQLHLDVAMNLDQLVSYLMTHSERIAAVRDGLETEAEQRTVLNEGLAAFFAKGEDDRQLGFGIQVEVFQR